MPDVTKDWSPEAYGRFRGLRLRPALDLLAQVGDLPVGDVIDLGCGNGAVGEALARHFPDRHRVGVDLSPAMLAKAAATGAYHRIVEDDMARWVPETPPALVFSNAALHWLGDHAALMPRLVHLLPKGGVLAVQMPRQHDAPSHALLGEVAVTLFPDRFAEPVLSPVLPAVDYARMLAPLGQVTAWETEYIQPLPPAAQGHPVRAFTESTAMRPYLDRLTAPETEAFVRAYDAALAMAYDPLPDGTVLMPFRRVFFTVTR